VNGAGPSATTGTRAKACATSRHQVSGFDDGQVVRAEACATTAGTAGDTPEIIRVLAVDHNPLMRDGLALLVRLHPDMHLVGAVATAEEALQMYIEQRPDVTLMDLDLPLEAAFGAIRKIRARDAGARIIGLTTYEPDAAWARALAAGACQCVAKDGVSDALPGLIRNGKRGPGQLSTPENGG
jgi:CheY-like chemotaxis protein